MNMNGKSKQKAANVVRVTGKLFDLHNTMEVSKTSRIPEEEKVLDIEAVRDSELESVMGSDYER